MPKYALVQLDDVDFAICKNDLVIWTVRFPYAYTEAYGFSATCKDGNNFVLKNKGMLFWKNLILYNADKVVGKFNRKRCIYPLKDLWIDSRYFIYLKDKHISKFDRSGESLHGGRAIYQWDLDISEAELMVATLAIVSIQNKAQVTGVRY